MPTARSQYIGGRWREEKWVRAALDWWALDTVHTSASILEATNGMIDSWLRDEADTISRGCTVTHSEANMIRTNKYVGFAHGLTKCHL